MGESRQTTSRGAGTALRKLVPPPALCGFLLLLVLMFAVSYAVGAAAGPVAPGMQGTTQNGGGGGGTDMGDMQDGHDMPGSGG
ncbi:hypothetical protein ACWCQ0_39415 [Streptomyces massasporeus]|uniref:hypothetical protein n=1 Tax=Streptomyces massasporeus TaxID=67324 RepID=UPI00340B0371